MSEHIDRRDAEVVEAIEDVVAGRMDRQDFVKRLTALGIGATALGGMLTALGNAELAAAATGGGGKPYDGQTVTMLVAAEGDEKGVQDKAGEIKERFGINLKVTALAVGPLIEKANQAFKAPTSPFDIVNVLGFSVSQMVGGNNFERLNPYLRNRSKTPASYAFGDFPAGQLEYVGYFNPKAQSFGGRDLYLVPGLHGGSAILFYRRDLLRKAGLSVPRNWAQYLAAARKLNADGVAGNSMIAKSGDVSMFLVDWYTRFITTGGRLMSGSPKTNNFRPRVNSREGVAALQHMVDCAKVASDGVLQYDFTASVDAFSAGRTAMMLMWSTIAGGVYDSARSKVAGKVAVATPPGTGRFAGRAVRGGWGVGIPKNARNKDAAWQVITYLTSKEWERYQVGKYKTDPSRKSTYVNPALVRSAPYLPTAGRVFDKAKILEIAIVLETFELITAAAEEFSAALNGSSTAAEAAGKANDRWVTILKRGGHLA